MRTAALVSTDFGRVSRRSCATAISALLVLGRPAAAQVAKPGPSSGSAFAVHGSGKLLTNNHVVASCSEVSVTTQGGATLLGRVAARDARNDLALIAVDSPLASVASFRRTPIRSGEDVIALGFPLPGILATDLNVSKGIVSAMTHQNFRSQPPSNPATPEVRCLILVGLSLAWS